MRDWHMHVQQFVPNDGFQWQTVMRQKKTVFPVATVATMWAFDMARILMRCRHTPTSRHKDFPLEPIGLCAAYEYWWADTKGQRLHPFKNGWRLCLPLARERILNELEPCAFVGRVSLPLCTETTSLHATSVQSGHVKWASQCCSVTAQLLLFSLMFIWERAVLTCLNIQCTV